MATAYDALHQYLQEDLAAGGAYADEPTLEAFENFAQLTEGEPRPDDPRSTRGKRESDGSFGPVTNTNPWNILKLNFTELTKLAAGTVKDVGILLVEGRGFDVAKAGVALASLINRFHTAATRKLDAADGRVIFAIARVDQRQVRKSDIKSAYEELFAQALSDDHLEKAIDVLADHRILIETGASVRLKERLEISL